jgi:NAD(P)-dependent dehydrogenase (short-subunit alcohol dehydrogenase family)
MSLAGLRAIVTGASRGIGQAIAQALATAGADVGLIARDETALAATAADLGARWAVADVTDEAAVRAAFDRLGATDLLVAAAGRAEAWGAFWELDPEAWWRDVEVNLRSAYLCARAAWPGMRARGGGRIVTLASLLGNAPLPEVSGYVVGKATLIRLTESLAVAGAAAGIRAFALSPGIVRTEMTTSVGFERFVGPLSDADWVSAERAAAAVVAIARGERDAESGRFLHVQGVSDSTVLRIGGGPW